MCIAMDFRIRFEPFFLNLSCLDDTIANSQAIFTGLRSTQFVELNRCDFYMQVDPIQ
ncbi:hypothetical protein D3C73_1376420 [compost metagenome]